MGRTSLRQPQEAKMRLPLFESGVLKIFYKENHVTPLLQCLLWAVLSTVKLLLDHINGNISAKATLQNTVLPITDMVFQPERTTKARE